MSLPTILKNDLATLNAYKRECFTPNRSLPTSGVCLAVLRIGAVALGVVGAGAWFAQYNSIAKGAFGATAVLAATAFGIPRPGTPQQSPPSPEPRFTPPQEWSGEERSKLALNTVAYINYGLYNTNGVEKHAVYFQKGNQLAARSQFIPPRKEKFSAEKNHYLMKIIVKNQDCIEMAKEFVEEGHKTALVNFANPETPGGGFLHGSRAQEEQICFRSELAGMMHFLQNDQSRYAGLFLFKQHFGGLIHTPEVLVFREGELKNFDLLNDPFRVGILTSAAPECPDIVKVEDKMAYKNEKMKTWVKAAIRTQLQTAYEQGYEAIILGAFGCGVFMNPTHAVAELYHEVLSQEFKGAFKRVGFAIIEGRRYEHNPEGNLKPFQDRFPNTTL